MPIKRLLIPQKEIIAHDSNVYRQGWLVSLITSENLRCFTQFCYMNNKLYYDTEFINDVPKEIA